MGGIEAAVSDNARRDIEGTQMLQVSGRASLAILVAARFLVGITPVAADQPTNENFNRTGTGGDVVPKPVSAGDCYRHHAWAHSLGWYDNRGRCQVCDHSGHHY